MKFNLTLWD